MSSAPERVRLARREGKVLDDQHAHRRRDSGRHRESAYQKSRFPSLKMPFASTKLSYSANAWRFSSTHRFRWASITAFSSASSNSSDRLMPNAFAWETKSIRAETFVGFRSA